MNPTAAFGRQLQRIFKLQSSSIIQATQHLAARFCKLKRYTTREVPLPLKFCKINPCYRRALIENLIVCTCLLFQNNFANYRRNAHGNEENQKEDYTVLSPWKVMTRYPLICTKKFISLLYRLPNRCLMTRLEYISSMDIISYCIP